MLDLDFVQLSALPLVSIIGYVCYKLIWPRLMDSADANRVDQRVTTGLINQLVSERDKANARADAAETRADDMFKELSDVKAQLTVMTYQLKVLTASNLDLKERMNELKGGPQ